MPESVRQGFCSCRSGPISRGLRVRGTPSRAGFVRPSLQSSRGLSRRPTARPPSRLKMLRQEQRRFARPFAIIDADAYTYGAGLWASACGQSPGSPSGCGLPCPCAPRYPLSSAVGRDPRVAVPATGTAPNMPTPGMPGDPYPFLPSRGGRRGARAVSHGNPPTTVQPT